MIFPREHRDIFLFFLAIIICRACPLMATEEPDRQYILIGVSGGLQDGFPDHNKLDFHAGESDESKAIYLGYALVRGYKAFLDVMQEGWRQYTPEPGQPLINSNVMASGCYEHANQYAVYITDSRQVINVLNNEPRFLSITPDTGLIDLLAEDTSQSVRDYMHREIERQGKKDMDFVALPIVTAVWFHESFVPSPPIRVLDDGTEVTNFPESLALWAGVDDSGRTAVQSEAAKEDSNCPSDEALAAEKEYWDGIRRAVRAAEENRPTAEELKSYGPPFECKEKARFGVGLDTARVNYAVSASDIVDVMKEIGYDVDFAAGELRMSSESQQ